MSRLAPLVRLTLCGAVVTALAQPAFAQTHYGARKAPNVTVDMTVLDELGAVPNVPQVLAPTIPRPTGSVAQPVASAPTGIVHLRPPSEKKRGTKAKPAAAPAKTAKTAAPLVPATTTPEPLVPPPAPVPAASAPAAPPAPPPPAAAPAAPPAPPAASPAPPAAPAQTAPTQTAPQMAARPAAVPADTVRITFDPGATELSEAAKQALKGVADRMQADQESRLQLVAYALGPGDKGNEARRTSLSRALSARQFLIGLGVRSTRIDVRALGHTDEAPADRVDAVVAKR